MRLFTFYMHKFNFGDALTPVITQKIAGRKIGQVQGETIGKRNRYENYLFTLGSLFQYVVNNDVIWGTGVNTQKINPPASRLQKLDIRAVRGPLTKDFIVKNYSISCPDIFGDPALLLPRLFPELKHNPVRKYAIIPHGADLGVLLGSYDNMMSPYEELGKIIDFILGSEFVISSSLHGIVVAEAFGVPARWLSNERLPSFQTEHLFKYNDYYLGTERSPDDLASSVDEAFKMKGKEPIKISFDRLYEAFPHDVFNLKNQFASLTGQFLDTLVSLYGRFRV